MENKKKIYTAVGCLAVLNLAAVALAIVAVTLGANKVQTKLMNDVVATTTSETNTDVNTEPEEPTEPSEPEDPTDPEDPETPDTPETPEDPSDPEEPSDPETPEEPEEPETPEDPEVPEEPEEPTVPTIDPYTAYDFNMIKDLLKTYTEELNGSECTVRVKVAGTAFGTPGYCFFTDVSEETITRGSQITQERMSEMLAREDIGNNNANFNRGDITVLSGVVSYEHSSYLGVDLVVIR